MPFKGLFGSKKGKESDSKKSGAGDPFSHIALTPGYYGQFPQSFHIFYTGDGSDKKTKYYCLVGNGPTPMYALTQLPGMVKHQLTLHSTPDRNSPPLALGGIDKLMTGKHCFALPAQPGAPTSNQLEYLKDAGSIKAEKWIFSAVVGPVPRQETFEWRGDNLFRKDQSQYRRTLVRVGGPTGEEVVCVWTNEPNPKAESKLGSVQFYGSGATGELGPYWTLLAVMTLIRACQAEWMAQVVLDGMAQAAGKLAGFGLGFV